FAGQSLWQGGAGEGFLVKVNPAGNIAWASHIDGVNGTTLQDIAVGADGGVIVCGYTGGGTLSGPLQFKGTAGTYNLPVLGPYTDAFIAKYSSTGAVLWARNVSGPSHQNGYDVAADSAGNVFLLGTMYEATTFDSSNIAGSTYQAPLFTAAYAPSGFLAKYSASGAYVWSKELAATNGFAPNDVVVDDSGQVFVGGSFQGAAAAAVSPIQYVSAGKTDGIVIKYRGSNGNYMWSTRYGSAEHDIVYGLGIGKSRELYVTGSVGVTTNFNPGGPSGMVTYIDYYPGAYRPRAFLVKYSNPIITAGGANLALNPLQIHPNPTTDAVTIEGAKAGTSYTVRSVLGPQVARGIVSSSQQTVSLEGLPPGIYIMMLSDKEGTRESARIIKR
ncbi:MAG TPA: T9SS type A sorting domain-containing protein, partial [Fibrella sp.]